MTQHQHRLILIVPVAKVGAIVGWLHQNIGPNCVPSDLGPPLNASGLDADPATHRWCCASFTDQECREILKRFCQLASIPPLTNAQWQGRTGPQKRAWLASVRDGVRDGFGVHLRLADNPGNWDDPESLLSSSGLKRVSPAVTARERRGNN